MAFSFLPEKLEDLYCLKKAAGLTSLLAFSAHFIGFLWTLILGLSFIAVLRSLPFLADGDGKSSSFENLYNTDETDSKRKRLLAKKKQNYIRRNELSVSGSSSLENSFEKSSSPQNMQAFEFSATEYFDSPGKLTQSGNYRQKIPSLRSPQPLLSAIKTRICIRDSKSSSPVYPFVNKYPKSQSREILRDLQNGSSLNNMPLQQGSPTLSSRRENIFKAMSPPSGRYFSRINPEKMQSSFQSTMMTSFSNSMTEETWCEPKKVEQRSLEDTCSRKAVVKALQEKLTSKRKRNFPSQADTSFESVVEQPCVKMKKRRLDSDSIMSLAGSILPNDFNQDIKKRFISRSLSTKPNSKRTLDEDDNDVNTLEKKSKIEESKNKYGLKESEVETIVDDDGEDGGESMEVCKKQNKRKSNLPETVAKKGKQESKSKGSISSKSKSSAVKKTPSKSVETQTPSKLEKEKVKEAESPKTPKQLKTPFRKIFSTGFPSNLKPGSTEKRRRIPIYYMTAGDLETIEISREEYGERGVTSEAFQAAKNAAAKRASEMLNENENEKAINSSISAPVSSSATTSLGFNLAPSSATNLSSSSTATTTGFTAGSIEKSATPSLFGNQTVSSITSGNLTTSDVTSVSGKKDSDASSFSIVKPSTGFSFGSIATAPGSEAGTNTNAATTSTTINATSAPLASLQVPPQQSTASEPTKDSSTISGFKFGGSNATTTVASGFTLSASNLSAPASGVTTPASGFTGFGNVASGLGAPTSAVTTSTSGFPSFGATPSTKISNAPSPATSVSTQSFQAPRVLTAPQTQSVAPTLGGFTFGTQSSSKPEMPKPFAAITQAASSATQAVSSQSSGGFSFGEAAASQKPAVGGFSFNPTPNPTSLASASNTAGFASGFKFNPSPASTSKSASSSSSSNPGGFNFAPSASSQQAPAAGLFPAKTSAAATTSFGGFSFGTTKTQTGFSFGNTSTTTTQSAQNNPIPVPFGGTASSTGQTGSIFQSAASTQGSMFGNVSAPSTSASLFGQKTTTAAPTNIFGAPQSSTSSVPAFGSQTSGQMFGAVSQPAKTSAPLFGAPSKTTTATAPLFGAVSQNSGTSNLFGAKPSQASTSTPLFGTSNATTSFSFGSKNTNVFGSASTQTPTAGGFSFTNAPQSKPASATQNPFGQSSTNTGAKFSFGQSAPTANPFSAPGQPVASSTTTTGGFSFGQSAAPGFGQPAASQPAFGASTAPAFGSSGGQPQSTGGFSFGATLKPNTGGFSFSSGAAAGGFSSRPGTPTPLASNPNQPAMQTPGALFGTPQPQPGGFALGSGSVANRQQIKGKRRTRR